MKNEKRQMIKEIDIYSFFIVFMGFCAAAKDSINSGIKIIC